MKRSRTLITISSLKKAVKSYTFHSILKEIQKILSYQFSLKESEIEPEAKFELELGADSRDLLEIMSKIEETFNIEIAYEDVYEILTVKDAVIYIFNKKRLPDKRYLNFK